jgi:isocitrate/isopropylmalate dehydrogenase
MMLRTSLGQPGPAAAIEAAVSKALADGRRTADLADPADDTGGHVVVGTTAFATAVVEALQAADAGVPA